MKTLSNFLIIAVFIICCYTNSNANNVRITSDVTLVEQNTTDNYIYVKFDIAWDNSWKDTCNYDAVWVFIKFSNNNAWKHGYLSTENTEHSIGVNNGVTPSFSVGKTTINSVSQGVGIFIYRTAEGAGNINWQEVKLKWNYTQNGLTDEQATNASIKVFAIEMVYVPQKAFNVGSNGDEISHFSTSYFSSSTVSGTILMGYYKIISESLIQIRISSGIAGTHLYWSGAINSSINSSFPKGYASYFSMKYEITQEQYVEFLNSLQPQQQISRVSAIIVNKYMSNTSTTTAPLFRNGIRCKTAPTTTVVGEWGCDLNNNGIYNETDDGQNIACNYLMWDDALAYADWAGLRPMTELEYEKSSRGPFMLANEYAWGTTNVDSVLTINNAGTSNETSGTMVANAVFGNNANVQGPMRVGCFATGTSTRESAGASYYGIMELSGNLWEQVVPVISGTSASGFDGSNGDGELYSNGNTDVNGWLTTVLSSVRGGAWNTYKQRLRTSDRNDYATTTTNRKEYNGFRCVRSAQ